MHLTTTTTGENPLHIASRVPNGKVSADLLLKSGANVNSTADQVSDTITVIADRRSLTDTLDPTDLQRKLIIGDFESLQF